MFFTQGSQEEEHFDTHAYMVQWTRTDIHLKEPHKYNTSEILPVFLKIRNVFANRGNSRNKD